MKYEFVYKGSITAIVLMLVYVALHFIPFSWFVDVKELTYLDTCTGSDIVVVESERYPAWGMRGYVYAQVVLIDDAFVRETTIDRSSKFGYEVDTGLVSYDTKWSSPLSQTGRYGVNSWEEIYPLPGITIKNFTPYKDAQFNVIECNI